MKFLALIVAAFWIWGALGYYAAMRGPNTDDFGEAAAIWLIFAVAMVLTLILGFWMIVHWWPV